MGTPSKSHHVVVAGGSFAALEAALALRTVADGRVRLTLIAPSPVFSYRPAAPLEAFGGDAPLRYDLRAIAEDIGATYHRVRVEAVAPQTKRLRLSSGARISYDKLVLAIGARATVALPGALTFRDQRDVPLLRRLLEEMDSGSLHRLVFAVPSACSWPLPLYELALLSAARRELRGLDTEITIVTPEHSPLGVFGAEASDLIAGLLEERRVQFIGRSSPSGVRGDGALLVQFDAPIKADRVVAVPQLRGQRISGIPSDWWGFVHTESDGRVADLEHIYAAGDITDFPLKQGGLAAQQADRVAYAIARSLGFQIEEPEPERVLRTRLLGGEEPLFLCAEVDGDGQPTNVSIEPHGTLERLGSGKVFGRYLMPYLESGATPNPLAA